MIASESSDVQFGLQLVQADDVGEDHGDVLVVLRDDLLALPIALHHRLRHQRQQQPVVFPALLVEQIFLDAEVAAHLVEGRVRSPISSRDSTGIATS